MTTLVRADERAGSGHRLPTWVLKVVMAATGVVFVGFVFVHMVGNLKVYGGAASLDGYARWLREVGYPLLPRNGVLWALRVVLAVSLVAHVATGVTLWWRGRRARGPHRRHTRGYRPFAAATMLPGGVVIAAFVVVHLLDLTLGQWLAPATFRPPDPDGTIHAHANLVASFRRPPMALAYTATMLVIALHIEHGCRALLQDLGATGRRTRRVGIVLGAAIAVAVALGNAAIPLLVLAGVIA